MTGRFPFHTGLAIASFALVLSTARIATPHFAEVFDLDPARVPLSPLVRHVDPEPPPIRILPKAAAKSRLLDDSAGALDAFYAALWRTEKQEKGAVTRVEHYGDSPTTADLITGDIRTLLQKRYGDAGHGFILPAKPWAWYQHEGVRLDGSGWLMSPASRFEAHDGMFGLGGVSLTGGVSARSRIAWTDGNPGRVEIWFLRQPGGGILRVLANGELLGNVATGGDAKEPAFADYQVPATAHEIELRVDQGSVRIFGVVAERPGPGVVYDSLGLNGASITVLTRMFNQDHWTAELQHRKPNLIVINYGTNEADFTAFVDKQYEPELREAIRRAKAAAPDASILVMSPMDRGHHEGGEIVTMPTIPRIVDIQRRVAKETACGFFDTFTAMGGAGAMARWYAAKPRLVSADLIHPYPQGGRMIAEIYAREIAAGLDRYKLRQAVP